MLKREGAMRKVLLRKDRMPKALNFHTEGLEWVLIALHRQADVENMALDKVARSSIKLAELVGLLPK